MPEVLENKRIPELPNVPSIDIGDLIPLYDLSGDVTGYITIQQAINLFQTTPNIGVFAPVGDIVALKNLNTTDGGVWVNYGMIVVGSRGVFYLNRSSTLTADDINIVDPTNGPGRWIAASPIQPEETLEYDSLKEYDNSGEVDKTYAEYFLKSWKYINATATTEAQRVTVLGAGLGTPAENVYWTEISKTEITSLMGGDLIGSFPNPYISKFSGVSATASGTNTYTATLSPSISSYSPVLRYFIKFTNANTGPATLNLNGLGAKTIVKNGAEALVADDIKAGQIILLGYDGTNFQIIGGGSGGSSSPASETVSGIAEIATQGETDTGTDDTRFVTPLKLKTWSGILAKVLTGLSLATNAAITASDTILSALGKLQKQITDLITTVSGKEDSFTKNTAFNKNFGTGTTNIAEIGSTLSNSQTVETDSSGRLTTVAKATGYNLPLDTDLSSVSALDDTIPSAKSAKDYIDNNLTTQTVGNAIYLYENFI